MRPPPHLALFAFTADDPLTWNCPHCGLKAVRDQTSPPPASPVLPFKSHLAYVRDRRDEEAGEAILQEALAKLRTPGKIWHRQLTF